MRNLKKLGAVLALTFVFATSASAGISESPPCVPPGISESPPCAAAQTSDDFETPEQTNTAPAANAEQEISFIDLVLDVIGPMLFLI